MISRKCVKILLCVGFSSVFGNEYLKPENYEEVEVTIFQDESKSVSNHADFTNEIIQKFHNILHDPSKCWLDLPDLPLLLGGESLFRISIFLEKNIDDIRNHYLKYLEIMEKNLEKGNFVSINIESGEILIEEGVDFAEVELPAYTAEYLELCRLILDNNKSSVLVKEKVVEFIKKRYAENLFSCMDGKIGHFMKNGVDVAFINNLAVLLFIFRNQDDALYLTNRFTGEDVGHGGNYGYFYGFWNDPRWKDSLLEYYLFVHSQLVTNNLRLSSKLFISSQVDDNSIYFLKKLLKLHGSDNQILKNYVISFPSSHPDYRILAMPGFAENIKTSREDWIKRYLDEIIIPNGYLDDYKAFYSSMLPAEESN